MLSIAVSHPWPIHQLAINNAFLNGLLSEEVYMQQPPGFQTVDTTLVCKLYKSFHGFKQAPRA